MPTAILAEEPSAELFRDWGALHLRAGRFPFTDPIFFQSWWRHLGRGEGHRLHLVTVRDGGTLVAIAPQVVSRRRGVRLLQWAGINEFGYGDALCASRPAEDALWAAVRRSGRYDVALMKSLTRESESYDTLGQFSRRVRTDASYILQIRWPSSEAWMKEALSSHARKHYRNTENQLRARGAADFTCCPSQGHRDRTLPMLVAQKGEWARVNEVDCLFRTPDRALGILTELAAGAAARGTLYLASLMSGDSPVAILLGVVHEATLYLLFISYDPAWQKYSPGRLLLCKTLGWAIDQGLARVDLMRGGQEYKKQLTHLNPNELTDFTFPGSLIGRVAEPILARTYFKAGTA